MIDFINSVHIEFPEIVSSFEEIGKSENGNALSSICLNTKSNMKKNYWFQIEPK